MRVVVGIDGGEGQRDAVALADHLAAKAGGELTLAHVYSISWLAWSSSERERSGLRHNAEELVRSAAGALTRPYETRVVEDDSAARALHRLAESEAADVIVVSSGHRSRSDGSLGGVAESLLHGAGCAIAVAPAGYAARGPGLERVGVAYNGSEQAEIALEWASRVFGDAEAGLSLLQVFEAPAMPTYPLLDPKPALQRMRETLRHRLEARAAQVPGGASAELLEGPVVKALRQATEGLDLMVTGSRGYGPIRRVVLGSVSARLVRHAACPVVVLPRGGAPGS